MIRFAISICIALLVFAAVEMLARAATDMPLYSLSPTMGYIVRPSQSGTFAFKNKWAINELSMGTERRFSPSPAKQDVLLVGDSLVYGGNPYRAEEKLAPQLERRTGWFVWPAASGGWALQNELSYLLAHPEVTKAVDRIIFVLDADDFDHVAVWQSPFDHPLERPWPASWFLFQKYVLKPKQTNTPAPVKRWPDLSARFRWFVATAGKPVDVFFYAAKGAAKCGPIPRPFLTAAKWHCVAADSRWRETLYRDPIHPTPAGNTVLASIIASEAKP